MLTGFQRQVVAGLTDVDDDAASFVVKQAILQMRMQRFSWEQVDRFWAVIDAHLAPHVRDLVGKEVAAARAG